MAFLDNPTIILAHIRQSHVTSDDTGMCEMVLIDHDVDLEKIHPSMPGDSGSEIQGSNAQELKSLFEKKSLKEKPPNSGKQSILSVRLEQCPLQLNNPFNEYSKFDGKASDAVSHMYAIRLLTTSSERKCALKNQELRIASLNKMCSSLDEGANIGTLAKESPQRLVTSSLRWLYSQGKASQSSSCSHHISHSWYSEIVRVLD
ncbi:hypothetical protein CB1_001026005 [Camelus ferus]|nr:hypothetical protein CB1_001026005 [Camelus ferus]